MQRHIYRLILMILLFFGSLTYFIVNLGDTDNARTTETTDMTEASFPLVKISAGGSLINELHGYALDTMEIPRNELTPVEDAGKLVISVMPMENNIKSIKYELTDRTDDTTTNEGDAENIKTEKDGTVSAVLRFAEPLTSSGDYGLKLTVINDKGRRSYFYTTLRLSDNSKLKENIAFVNEFENAIFSGENESAVKPYLESNQTMDNSTLAHVNIHSSYELVTFNGINPTKVSDTEMTVLENNSNTSAFLLKYMVEAGKDNRVFDVREYFRVQYTEHAMYLLSYDRTMEEMFNPLFASLSRNQLLVGVTGDPTVPLTTSPDGNIIAFVRERELWYYSSAENKAVKVFSFRNGDTGDNRVNYDEHDIKILGMDNAGNIDFSVYGYMNRGAYEGRTGIVVYRYFHGENRVEEQVCVPVNEPYQMLREDLNDFSYVSGESFYYFEINGTIYSYSMIKKQLTVVAEGLKDNSFVYIKSEKKIAWQENSDDTKSEKIIVMNLENRVKTSIDAPTGRCILLFGGIDSNIVYGIANPKNLITNVDGTNTLPCTRIIISDTSGNALKTYFHKKIYVTRVTLSDSVIMLKRVKKKDGKFIATSGDQILNNSQASEKVIRPVTRVTKKYLTQYYLTLPYGVTLKEEPKVDNPPKMTIISTDVTLHMPDEQKSVKRYYACTEGQITASSENAGDIVKIADDGMGFVLDSDFHTVWERGVAGSSGTCDDIDLDYITEGDTSVQAAVRLFLTTNGVYISDKELYAAGSDYYGLLAKQEYVTPVNLTGASLDETLYYISKGNPVIAFTDESTAVLITGYGPGDVTLMDAVTGKTRSMSFDDADKTFSSAGNVFISSLD